MTLREEDVHRLKMAYGGYEEAAYEFAIQSITRFAHLPSKLAREKWLSAEKTFQQRQANYFSLLKTFFNEENDLEEMEDRIRDLHYRIDCHPELSELLGRLRIFNTYAGFKQAGFILIGLSLLAYLAEFLDLIANTPNWPFVLGFLLILALMPIEDYATRLNRVFHLKIKEVFPLENFKQAFKGRCEKTS